jgi:hypothetical protein
MFKKKKESPNYKSTDELLVYYRQNAIDSMVDILGRLKELGDQDPLILVSPITDYVQGLEVLVSEYSCKPRPQDFITLQWMKQIAERSFPPVRLPPWLNIGGG